MHRDGSHHFAQPPVRSLIVETPVPQHHGVQPARFLRASLGARWAWHDGIPAQFDHRERQRCRIARESCRPRDATPPAESTSSVQASFDLPLITIELTVAPSIRSADAARHREDGGVAGGKALFNRVIETAFETRVVRAGSSAQRFRARSSRAWRSCPAHATTSTTFNSLVSRSRIEHRHRLRRCGEMNWVGLP